MVSEKCKKIGEKYMNSIKKLANIDNLYGDFDLSKAHLSLVLANLIAGKSDLDIDDTTFQILKADFYYIEKALDKKDWSKAYGYANTVEYKLTNLMFDKIIECECKGD